MTCSRQVVAGVIFQSFSAASHVFACDSEEVFPFDSKLLVQLPKLSAISTTHVDKFLAVKFASPSLLQQGNNSVSVKNSFIFAFSAKEYIA